MVPSDGTDKSNIWTWPKDYNLCSPQPDAFVIEQLTRPYLVIILPKYYEKFTKSVMFELLRTLLEITCLTSSHIWSLFATNSYEKFTKIELGKVGVSSNIAQNHSSSF